MKQRVETCLVFAVVALAVLAAAVPAQASSSFKKLGPISDPSAQEHDVAADPSGRAFFVWDRQDPANLCGTDPCGVIEARVRSAGGTLGPVETISDPTQLSSDPEVAVDEDGNAVFTWVGQDNRPLSDVLARTRSAAGVLGPIQRISGSGFPPVRPHVASDEDGNTWFAWEQLDTVAVGPCTALGCVRVYGRARSAAGVLGPLHELSEPGKNAFFAQLGVDEDGKGAVFAWRLDDGTPSCGSCVIDQARALSRAGVLSPTQNLSSGFIGPPQVAVNESGNAVFTWEAFDDTTQCGGASCSRIFTRARSAKGTLTKAQILSDAKQDAVAPQVGIDDKGNAVFVWSRGDGSSDCSGGAACFRAQTRSRSSSGSLSKVQNVSDSGRNAFVPQVGVDGRGNAVFVWERINEEFDCGLGTCAQVQARSLSSSGSLSKIQTLSDLGPDANPLVAVDPNGGRDKKLADAAADWVGPTTQIEAAFQKGDD